MNKLLTLSILTAACLVAAIPEPAEGRNGDTPLPQYACQVDNWDDYRACIWDQIENTTLPWNCTGWANPPSLTREYLATCSMNPPEIVIGHMVMECRYPMTPQDEVEKYWACLQLGIDQGMVCSIFIYPDPRELRAYCAGEPYRIHR